jgi:hypothetical protein
MNARVLVAVMSLTSGAIAYSATSVRGNVSGIWTTNASPYILIADCTVPRDSTLNIQPGVTVIIAPDVSLRVRGGLSAIGSEDRRIWFRGATSSNYWGTIYFFNNPFTNQFRFCRFSEAQYDAVGFDSYGSNHMVAEVLNCDFYNCKNSGIFGRAYGWWSNGGDFVGGDSKLDLKVRNCTFSYCAIGLHVYLQANPNNGVGYGSGTVDVRGNVFKDITSDGVYLEFSYLEQGSNIFNVINNTFSRVERGVRANGSTERRRIEFINNIFSQCGSALLRSPAGDYEVWYNCFFGNRTNFSGYPGIYGIILLNNRNGDPCDAFYNIFLDPQFNDSTRYLLRVSSPCIDAGDPQILEDCSPSYSHGTSISDIGAYGGPASCTWGRHGFEPGILEQPKSQKTCLGSSATFGVIADGVEPLHYQWYFNSTTRLENQTNSSLHLESPQSSQAGWYSVVVTNAFGSTASDRAQLHVFDACVGIELYAGLNITGEVGRTYWIQYTTDLVQSNTWIPIATNTLTEPRWLYIDTATPYTPRRFYRVDLKP